MIGAISPIITGESMFYTRISECTCDKGMSVTHRSQQPSEPNVSLITLVRAFCLFELELLNL